MSDLTQEANHAAFASTSFIHPPLRLGILGCALGRSRYHAAIQASSWLQVAGLADSDERHARIWARDLGSRTPAYATVSALLERADTFDALLIASPLAERGSHLASALQIGKPILCEAPFALSLAEVETLNRQAQTANILLLPAFPRRFDSYFQAATQQLQSGAIGAIAQVRCHWSFPLENVDVSEDVVTGSWNALIQTLGSQTSDVCRWWQGNALTVSGDVDLPELRGEQRAGGRLPGERILANLIVAHEQGQSTHHLSRTRSVQPDERYLFTGATGSMELIVTAGASGASASAPLLRVQKAGEKFQTISVDSPPPSDSRMALSPAVARIQNLLHHFVECVQTGEAPQTMPDDARSAQEVIQAAYVSTQERIKISLPLRRSPDIRQILLSPVPSLSALPPSR